MKKILAILAFLLVCAAPALGQIQVQILNGYVGQGGKTVTVGGLPPTTATYLRTYPGATVTVYQTGTTNLATCYTGPSGGAKSNPFTSDPVTAYWACWVATGAYDIRFSGTGITTPWTEGGVAVGSGVNLGIGNGTTVIDASLQSGADFSVKVNAAIASATCAAVGCYIETAGMTGTQTMSVSIGPFGSSSNPITIHLGNGLVLTRAAGAQFLIGEWSNITGEGWRTAVYGAVGDDVPAIVAAPGAYRAFQIKNFIVASAGRGPCMDFDVMQDVNVENMQLACMTGIKADGYYNRFLNNNFYVIFYGPLIGQTWASFVGDCSQCFNSNDFWNNTYAGTTGTGLFLRGGYSNKIEGQENSETIGLGYYISSAATAIHGGYFEAVGATTAWSASTPYGLGAIVLDSNGNSEIAVTQYLTLTQATVSGASCVYAGTIPGGASNGLVGQYFITQAFGHASNNGGPWIASASSASTLTLANSACFNETHAGIATVQPSATSLSSGISKGKSNFFEPVGMSGGIAPTWSIVQGGRTYDAGVVWEVYKDSTCPASTPCVASYTLGWPAGHSILLENGGQTATVDGAIGTQVLDLNAVVGGAVTNKIQTMGNLAWGYGGTPLYAEIANPLLGFVFSFGNDDPTQAYAGFNFKHAIDEGVQYGPEIDFYSPTCLWCGHPPIHLGPIHAAAGIQDFGAVSISALPTPGVPTLSLTASVPAGGDSYAISLVALQGNIAQLPTLEGPQATIGSVGTLGGAACINVTVPVTFGYQDQWIGSNQPELWSMMGWEIVISKNSGAKVQVSPVPQYPPGGVYQFCGGTTYAYTTPTRNATGDLSVAGWVRDTTVLADQGNVCTNGEIVLSGGWGSTAAATAVAGNGQTCQWTFTSNGSGAGANPTVTDTLTNPLPAATTVCTMQMVGGTGTLTMINQTTLSATAPVFTFLGTPAGSSTTYIVVRRCGP